MVINKYIKRITAVTLLSLNVSMPVFAEWNKENDNWTWMEEEQRAIGWKQINGKWYYFDEDGYMNTGWIKDNDKWYYLNASGNMHTGWKNINDQWYYLDASGIMKSGWMKDNDNWYYLLPSGVMIKGWHEIDGEWYMFGDNGIMLTGWIKDNDVWYYANSSGKLEKGNITIDGETYTFAENGAMLSGSKSDNNEGEFDGGDNQNYDNKIGYVNTNEGTLNVRSDSSLNSTVVDKLKRGTEVNIIGEAKNGFYPILLNEKEVWVSSDWISFEKPSIDNKDVSNNSDNISNSNNNSSLSLGEIRTTAPSLDDIHYYSDSNIFYKVRLAPSFINSSGKVIKGNCTWYTWGRAWELTGEKPTQANFIGNAYEWWEANKKSGKYQYGSEPRVGSIAVWNSKLPGSGGCGHVAVVEKIDGDKIYISESMWHGDCFAYKEIYSTEYLYGYIYLDRPNY